MKNYLLFLGVISLLACSFPSAQTVTHCVECSPEWKGENVRKCSALLELFKEHRFRWKAIRNDTRWLNFLVNCPSDSIGCYKMKVADGNITEYDERGCGNGPDEILAEIGEHCEYGFIPYNNGTANAKIEMLKCVCNNKNYCNHAQRDNKIGIAFCTVFLLATAYNYVNTL